MQGALKVAMLSPGFIYEPYTPREKISFLKRLVTPKVNFIDLVDCGN